MFKAIINDDETSALVDQCFGAGTETLVVRIHTYSAESDVSKHRGFANLLKGIFGTSGTGPSHAAYDQGVGAHRAGCA